MDCEPYVAFFIFLSIFKMYTKSMMIYISTTVIAEMKEIPQTLFSNIPRKSSVKYQIRITYLSHTEHESST